MNILKLFTLGVFFGILNPSLHASPPQDLSIFEKPDASDDEAPVKPKRRLRFKEDDLTSGAPPAASDRQDSSHSSDNADVKKHLRYDVICRERPGRQGKPIVKLKKGQLVSEGKRSNQWSEVSYSAKASTCWIPTSAMIN